MKKAILLLGLFCTSCLGVQKRGVVEEVGNIFEGFSSSFDQIGRAAREEVNKLGPWSALDNLGFTFGNERVDSHFMDTTG